LAGAGFRDVRDAGRDATALARLIAQALPPATRILHLSGEAVAQDLAALLADSGIAVDRAPLYRAEPAAALSDGLVRALGACTVSYVVLFSVRTASSFGNLIERFGLTETMRATTALCLSQPIAAEAGRLGWTSIIVAAQPTSAALLDCLPPRDADDRRH
jgi:uroporphyrinogen-III synthase